MNKELKKQLVLSGILLGIVTITLTLWYRNFVFHTYGETLNYQYCFKGENEVLMIDGYEFYQDDQQSIYGGAKMTALKPLWLQGDVIKVSLSFGSQKQEDLTLQATAQNQETLTLPYMEHHQNIREENLQKVGLHVTITRKQEIIEEYDIPLSNQTVYSYTGANKDYAFAQVYATSSWLKTGHFSTKKKNLAEDYPYMTIDYLYLPYEASLQEAPINDYERFIYLKGQTQDFLDQKIGDVGYFDKSGSLLEQKLCCVVSLMTSKDDRDPYTFMIELEPVQKGEKP